MVYDTNLVIGQIRAGLDLPARAILPVIVLGEVRAIALRSGWGAIKIAHVEAVLTSRLTMEITETLTPLYARLDTYSQGKLPGQPLPPGMSARNMGKNDLWIAAVALYLEMPLHTGDHDFDHLPAFGLQLAKYAAGSR